MQPSRQQWLWVRIVAMGVSVLFSKSFVQMPGDFSKPSISFALILAGFCAFGICFLWLLQLVNPLSAASWGHPSWLASPFSIRQPLELFHLAGWCLIASGVGALFFGLLSVPRNWAWELPFSAGVGTLVGVHLVAGASRSGTGA